MPQLNEKSKAFEEVGEAKGIAASQVMIGILMSKLIDNGLRKCEVDPIDMFADDEYKEVRHDIFNTEGRKHTPEQRPELIEVQLLCGDVMAWLIEEGIARSDHQTRVLSGHTYFSGVQLTSKGIDLAMQNNNEYLGGKSAIETLKNEKHNFDLYQKLGSFIGAALAGFTKAIS